MKEAIENVFTKVISLELSVGKRVIAHAHTHTHTLSLSLI